MLRQKSTKVLRALAWRLKSAFNQFAEDNKSSSKLVSERVTSDQWVESSFQLLLGRGVDSETVASRIGLQKSEQVFRLLRSSEFATKVIPEILHGTQSKRSGAEIDSSFLREILSVLGEYRTSEPSRESFPEKIPRAKALVHVLKALSRHPGGIAGSIESVPSTGKISATSLDSHIERLRRLDDLVAKGEFSDAFIAASVGVRSAPGLFLDSYLALHYHLCWDLLSFHEILRSLEHSLSGELFSRLSKHCSNTFFNDQLDRTESQPSSALTSLYPNEYHCLFERSMAMDAIKERFNLWSVLQRFEIGRSSTPQESVRSVVWLMPNSADAQQFAKRSISDNRSQLIKVILFGPGEFIEGSTPWLSTFNTFEDAIAEVRKLGSDTTLVATDGPIELPLHAIQRLPDDQDEIVISHEVLELNPKIVGLSAVKGRSANPIGIISHSKSAVLEYYDSSAGFADYARRIVGDRLIIFNKVVAQKKEADHSVIRVSIRNENHHGGQFDTAPFAHHLSIQENETSLDLLAALSSLTAAKDIPDSVPVIIMRDEIEYHPAYESILIQSHLSHRNQPVSGVAFYEHNGRLASRQRHPAAAPSLTQIGLVHFSCASLSDMRNLLSQNPDAKIGSCFIVFDQPAIVPDFVPSCATHLSRHIDQSSQQVANRDTLLPKILAAAQNSIYERIKGSPHADINPFYRFYISFKERAERSLRDFSAGDIRQLERIDSLLQADFLNVLRLELDVAQIQTFLKRMFSRRYALIHLSSAGFNRLAQYAQKFGVQEECCRLALPFVEAVVTNNPSKMRAIFQLLNGGVSSGEFQSELMRLARSVAGARRFRPAKARKVAEILSAYASSNTALIFLQQVKTRYESLDSSLLSIVQRLAPLLNDEDLRSIGFTVDPSSEAIAESIASPAQKLTSALSSQQRSRVIHALDELVRNGASVSIILNILRSFSAEVSEMQLSNEEWPYRRLLDSSDALNISIVLGDKETIADLTQHISDDEVLAIANASTGSFTKLNALYASWAKACNIEPVKFRGDSVQEVFRSISRTAGASAKTSDGPLISIIMSIYDGPLDLLELSLLSLLRQTHQNLEILLVDDHSQPHLSEQYRKIAAKHSQVEYHWMPTNLGPYLGRNFALSKANGEFIAIQDADDFAHPQRLAHQVHLMQQNDYLRGLTCPNLRFDRNGNVQFEHGLSLRGDGTMATMFRKSVFDEIGPFASVRSRGDVEYRERIVKAFGQTAFHKIECPMQFCYAASTTLSQNVARERAQHLADFRTAIDAHLWPIFADKPIGKLAIPTLLRP